MSYSTPVIHGPAAPPASSETMMMLKIEPKCGPSKISATTEPIRLVNE